MKITAAIADAFAIGITPEQAADWDRLRDTLDRRTAGGCTCIQLDRLTDMVQRRIIAAFRKPDVRTLGYCIWYGPAGAEGDCATEVAMCGADYIVRQYQHLEGYVDDYTNAPFLVTEVMVRRGMARSYRDAAAIGTALLAVAGGSEWYAKELPR